MKLIEELAQEMKISEIDVKRLISKACVIPYTFKRNSNTSIYFNNDMVMRIKKAYMHELIGLAAKKNRGC